MKTVHTIEQLRAALGSARDKRIGFVPTMGNLHAGHLALVHKAQGVSQYCVVSIFVNPLQFGEGEDYDSYPRSLERDIDSLSETDTRLVFIPSVAELYPLGLANTTRIEVPELGTMLCGTSRPVFFSGVTTVVGILFNLVMPDVALFGEKDFQQLVIIKRMVSDLHMPIDILSVATVREPDGLALSSRNAYLTPEERARAPSLYRALCQVREAVNGGERDFKELEMRGVGLLSSEGFRPDYVSVRRAADLSVPGNDDVSQLRVLAAARLGQARLIDNIAVEGALTSGSR